MAGSNFGNTIKGDTSPETGFGRLEKAVQGRETTEFRGAADADGVRRRLAPARDSGKPPFVTFLSNQDQGQGQNSASANSSA